MASKESLDFLGISAKKKEKLEVYLDLGALSKTL